MPLADVATRRCPVPYVWTLPIYVGCSCLNTLIEFSVEAQIALRRNEMVGHSHIDVETIGESFPTFQCWLIIYTIYVLDLKSDSCASGDDEWMGIGVVIWMPVV